MTEDNNSASSGDKSNLTIVRVYLKDVSFEVPNSPQIFTGEWNPETNLELHTLISAVDTDIYEIVLNVTVTAKQGDKTGFLIEVQQAGLFSLTDFDEKRKDYMLGAYCPNVLFPFAREAISDLVTKGGFPQLLLSPVNFNALYAQSIERSTSRNEETRAN